MLVSSADTYLSALQVKPQGRKCRVAIWLDDVEQATENPSAFENLKRMVDSTRNPAVMFARLFPAGSDKPFSRTTLRLHALGECRCYAGGNSDGE